MIRTREVVGRVCFVPVVAGAVVTLAPVWLHQLALDVVDPFSPTTLIFWLTAHFLGGIVAGVLSPLSPGFNGALSTFLAAFVGAARFLVAVLPNVAGPVDAYTRSENLGLLAFWAVVFAGFSSLALLGGFFGGRTGVVLRRRTDGRTTRRAG